MSFARISVRGLSKQYRKEKTAPHKHRRGAKAGFSRFFKLLVGGASGASKDSGYFWALKDIAFDVMDGERVGVIGKNGAGKSTLLKILSRLTYPTEGEALIRGRVTSLLEVGTGFNPSLTGRENVYLNGMLYGLDRKAIEEKFQDIVEFSGVKTFIDMPVKHYSSGMRVRLAFSVVAHLEPDILILDEVLAVGDMAFQKKCLDRMEGMTSKGRTLLFVSHSMGDVMRFCDRAIWLDHGRVVRIGDVQDVAEAYSKSMMSLCASYRTGKTRRDDDGRGGAPDKPDAQPAPPGDDSSKAELISFELQDASGEAREMFFLDEPIYLIVEYRVLEDDIPVIAAIHVIKDGVHVFSSHPKETFSGAVLSTFRSRVEIPARTLNTGEYRFSVAITTPSSPVIRHVSVEEALRCMVVERFDQDRVFGGNYRGVLRPQLVWETTKEKEEA